jgi:hypothetical protein
MYDPKLVDITESHALGENREFDISIHVKHPVVSHDGEAGSVWVIVKKSEKRVVVHLINLIDQTDDTWNSLKRTCTVKPAVTLHIPRYSSKMRVFCTSPENGGQAAEELTKRNLSEPRTPSISIELESLPLWATVWCDL